MEQTKGGLITSNMDVDAFVVNLLDKALHRKSFIKYSGGFNNFLHQIRIKADKLRSPVGTVEDLLKESMQLQSLKFSGAPEPALFIQMPRCNGKLVGHKYILPNLKLRVTDFENPVTEVTFDLMAVVALRSMHYTTFIRHGTETHSPWDYFDSLPAIIKRIPFLGTELQDFEFSNRKVNENVPSSVRQIIGDLHFVIYQQQKSSFS